MNPAKTPHKNIERRRQNQVISLSAQGGCVRYSTLATVLAGQEYPVGGKRSAIKSFSNGSAKRLSHLMSTLDFKNSRWLFVTLTYPPAVAPLPIDSKRHMELFAKRILRKWPDASFVADATTKKKPLPPVDFYEDVVFLMGASIYSLETGEGRILVDDPECLRRGGFERGMHTDRGVVLAARRDVILFRKPDGSLNTLRTTAARSEPENLPTKPAIRVDHGKTANAKPPAPAGGGAGEQTPAAVPGPETTGPM